MAAHEMYAVAEQSGQWWVVDAHGVRVAGPFAERAAALADARDRALDAEGPSSAEGEDVKVQQQYGGTRK